MLSLPTEAVILTTETTHKIGIQNVLLIVMLTLDTYNLGRSKALENHYSFMELLKFWVVNDKRNYLVKINSGGKRHKARSWQSRSTTWAPMPWGSRYTSSSAAYREGLTASSPLQSTAQLFVLPPLDFIFLFFHLAPSPGVLI